MTDGVFIELLAERVLLVSDAVPLTLLISDPLVVVVTIRDDVMTTIALLDVEKGVITICEELTRSDMAGINDDDIDTLIDEAVSLSPLPIPLS